MRSSHNFHSDEVSLQCPTARLHAACLYTRAKIPKFSWKHRFLAWSIDIAPKKKISTSILLNINIDFENINIDFGLEQNRC